VPAPSSLVSLNVGLPRPLRGPDREVSSSIVKTSVSRPLSIDQDGLEGNSQADLKNHGGPDKAACVYATEHLPYWSERLGTGLVAGAFGENLSVSGLVETEVRIGDVFRIGSARVQVSQPRGPCFKLGLLHRQPQLALWVQDAGLTGFYFRCLEPGTLAPGDAIELIARDPEHPTVTDAVHAVYREVPDAAIRRVADCALLSDAWRRALQRRLDKRAAARG
jgi:MOSC domain-containing protein YiiM